MIGREWGRIVTARVEGVATQNAAQREVGASCSSVQPQTFVAVARTRGLESTDRAEQGGEHPLVDANEQHQQPRQHGQQDSSDFGLAMDVWQRPAPLAEDVGQLPVTERLADDDDDVYADRQLVD